MLCARMTRNLYNRTVLYIHITHVKENLYGNGVKIKMFTTGKKMVKFYVVRIMFIFNFTT